jgi:hypothetical protein
MDLGGGSLENRGRLFDLDPDPHELGPIRKKRDLVDLADGDAGEADVRALVDAADGREIDVVAFHRLARETGEPDDEKQSADQ